MIILFIGLIAIAAIACKKDNTKAPEILKGGPAAADAAVAANPDNPFFKPYGTPFNVPPFDRIKTEHFLPAIQEGIRREQAEVDAIIANRAKPTFENTIAALDHAGIFLSEVNGVFGSLQGALTNKDLQALARQTAPLLAAHNDNIGLDRSLRAGSSRLRQARFAHPRPRGALPPRDTYKDFVRGGGLLDQAEKARFRELNRKLRSQPQVRRERPGRERRSSARHRRQGRPRRPPVLRCPMASASAKQAGLADG